jgi:hypothetical protein
LRETLGLDARELTPLLVQRIALVAAEARSFKRAAVVMKHVGDSAISAKTIERVVHDIGPELAERRDADPRTGEALAMSPASPLELAVVGCDGGRIRTREPGYSPGVHCSTESWRQTKNAVLIRATRTVSDDDPQPEPPTCFCDSEHVVKIVETESISVASSSLALSGEQRRAEHPPRPEANGTDDWRPKRLVRTVLRSIADSKEFGKQMEREAKRRRFFEAKAKAFLGDGLPWNWSIWKRHFSDFTPLLDFIDVLSYLFLAAKAVHNVSQVGWDQYLVWTRGAWQADVAQVLEELPSWQDKLGVPDEGAADGD